MSEAFGCKNVLIYWKVSLISSCSRLCEILFHLLFCDHDLIANAGGCQTLVSKGKASSWRRLVGAP